MAEKKKEVPIVTVSATPTVTPVMEEVIPVEASRSEETPVMDAKTTRPAVNQDGDPTAGKAVVSSESAKSTGPVPVQPVIKEVGAPMPQPDFVALNIDIPSTEIVNSILRKNPVKHGKVSQDAITKKRLMEVYTENRGILRIVGDFTVSRG